MSFKKICICLILIFCIIGAASAAEDVSADVVDVADDSVAVDAVSEDQSDSIESIVVEEESVVDDSAVGSIDDDMDDTKDVLKDDSSPMVLYINVSEEGGGDNSGKDWENPMRGDEVVYDSIAKIGNNGIIYLAEGIYDDDFTSRAKNYTLIGQNNTILKMYGVTEQNQGTHTFINLIFLGGNSNADLSFANQRYDCERVFINCTFKMPRLIFTNGNDVEESTGLMRFDNCIFEDYNNFIDMGKHINATFNNCTFKNIQADSLIKITSNLIQYVKLSDCTFENCVMNGVVNLGMNVEPEDYVAIENCNYDFDATVGVVSDENENYYLNATKLKPVPVDSAVDISSSEKGVVVIALTDNSSAPIAGATVKYTVKYL